MQNVPLMPEKMKQMSIQDFKVQEESQEESKEEFDQEHKFLDALVKYLVDKEIKMVLARTIGLTSEESNKGECNKSFKSHKMSKMYKSIKFNCMMKKSYCTRSSLHQ